MTWDLGPHHLPDILLCPWWHPEIPVKMHDFSPVGSHSSAPLILFLHSMLLSVCPAPTAQPFKSLSRQSPIVTSSIFKLEFGWLTTHTSKHLHQWMWEHSVMTKAFCSDDGIRIPGLGGWLTRWLEQHHLLWEGYMVAGVFTCMPTLSAQL